MIKSPRSAFISDRAPPRYFSIDAGRPFLADLARGLIEAFGDDLARAEVYLPTRRAVRSLADAILDARAESGVRAAFLPRLRAIGDVDDVEMVAFAGDPADEIDLPPAISGTARTLALARLVAARDRAFAGQENWPGAIAAAGELAKLLDSLYAEELDPAILTSIDVGEHAAHWDVSRKFLEIVTREWPGYLASSGLCDPADRRARMIGAKARRLAASPPDHPIVIAGTTASAPAVARLMAAIAAAPRGAAVLPGLDRSLDAAALGVLDDAHPQAGLRALLATIGQSPSAIAPWPGSDTMSPRARLLNLALRPAQATDDWLTLIAEADAVDPGLAAACEGLCLMEAETEDAEAAVIAMMFRETLETAKATAMLVTPDRNLARRVALKMRRWNVTVDDSGGVPFANSRCGTFLRLVASFLADPDDPVSMLALLDHPYATFGFDESERLRAVDTLDRCSRGPRPAGGLAGVEARLRSRRPTDEAATGALMALRQAAAGFGDRPEIAFSGRLRAHLGVAEALAGADRLWSGEDGEAAALLLAGIISDVDALNDMKSGAYVAVFDALIAGAVIRRRSEAHPRLSILGPLEARLLGADHVILGGLNEGVWPADAPADPFLSATMRERIGLPSSERRIGLAAHDFAQGAAAGRRVSLTRAKRSGGAPAKPSRWLVRLRNILKGAGALDRVDLSASWNARAERLDAPNAVLPVNAPRPRAGKDRRPGMLAVTDIEAWIRDPYAIYAKRLLHLRKLDDPGAPVGPREVGSLLHRVFERAARAPAPMDVAALRVLLDDEAARTGLVGADRAFWSASLEEAVEWFAGFDREQRLQHVAFLEEKGLMSLDGVDPPFTLTARADRIDVLGGGAEIVDYKTGQLPSEKQDKHFSSQLPLTGAIIEAGGFPAIGPVPVTRYRYIRLTNRAEKADDPKNEIGRTGGEASSAIADAKAKLRAWIAHFDRPDAVYLSQPRPQFVKHEGDFDQLARRREWMANEDSEGNGE